MSLYIDLTEFLLNPITTGIQRIEGELCRYLPQHAALPIRFWKGGYAGLPRSLMDAIARYFTDRDPAALQEIRDLSVAHAATPVAINSPDIVLVPEVVVDDPRLVFFANLPGAQLRQFRFIVYDLLPITHPEFFPSWVLEMCRYYRVLRRSTHLAFISEETRSDFYGRFMRTPRQDGIVLPLGSDALGPKAERPLLNRPLTFSVLGTIEPRKNHKLILDAFEPLLRKLNGLTLRFVGRMGWIDDEFAQKVLALASDPNSGFQFEERCSDTAIRRLIEESRATIYVSVAEGYGLPPVESLWVGTPVIASRTIPSLNAGITEGVYFLPETTAEHLREAVLQFCNDAYANEKSQEAACVQLPTWQSFTQQVLEWCAH